MPSIWIAQGVMMVTGVVIFARVFEVMVYTMVAPIPLSSFSNEEHRQIGIGFIKGYTAVCLQALMIVVMFAAFAALGNELDALQLSLSFKRHLLMQSNLPQLSRKVRDYPKMSRRSNP